MREPEDYPDKTVDELLEQDEDNEFSLTEDEYDEMFEEYKEMREGAVLLMQGAALGEMLAEGEITLRRYIQFIDWIEAKADEKGVDLP
jgi:hypothetical protein